MAVIVLRYLFVGEFKICFFEILMNEGLRKNSMLLWLEIKIKIRSYLIGGGGGF